MTDKLALEGVRIADFSWQIAGPTCTRYLGAMGAEVIRIESNRRPDPYRQRSISHFINQSKKSITLNLGHPQGVELAHQLVSISDVVIENFAPGVIQRLGLGYEELRQVRPEVIMLSSAGLGHSGPDYQQVAYGTLVQCFTGWSALQGYPGREPDIGGIWTDPMVGMMEVFLINAALHRRWQSGEGQYIDLSMAEATTMLLPEAILDYSMNQRVPQPLGNRHPSHAPHGNYPCLGEDQWIGIAVTSDGQWEALCTVLQSRELQEDPRFADALGRWRNQEALDVLIATATREWDGLELTERLQKAGVPAGPALSVDQLWDNPHLRTGAFSRPTRRRSRPGAPSGSCRRCPGGSTERRRPESPASPGGAGTTPTCLTSCWACPSRRWRSCWSRGLSTEVLRTDVPQPKSTIARSPLSLRERGRG